MGETRKVPEVSDRVLKDVREYVERMADANGALQRSLHVIGEDLGYSHASIHRALAALEMNGVLEIDRSVQPNVIRFKDARQRLRPENEADVANALIEVEKAFARLKAAYLTLVDDNRVLREIAAEWLALKPYLIDRIYLAERSELILTFKVNLEENPRLQQLV